MGATNLSGREMNAAAELQVVSRARNLIGWYESSFSTAASAAVASNGGRVSLVEWWEALESKRAIKKVLQEMCVAGPVLATVERTCRHYGLTVPSPMLGSGAVLNHLSMRSEGVYSLEQMRAECTERQWCCDGAGRGCGAGQR